MGADGPSGSSMLWVWHGRLRAKAPAGVKLLHRASQSEDTTLKQGGGALSALLQGRGWGAVVTQGAQPNLFPNCFTTRAQSGPSKGRILGATSPNGLNGRFGGIAPNLLDRDLAG